MLCLSDNLHRNLEYLCDSDLCKDLELGQFVEEILRIECLLDKKLAEVKKMPLESGLFTFIMVKEIDTMIFIVSSLCIKKEQMGEGLAVAEKVLEDADKKGNNIMKKSTPQQFTKMI